MKRIRSLFLILVVASVAALLPSLANATPITYDFSFSNGGGATASGYITFDSTLLNSIDPPIYGGYESIPINNNPLILGMSLTISGASAGNGTFGPSYFSNFLFDTGGGQLDFTQSLVGQATPYGPWGPASGIGDFNFEYASITAPTDTFFFQLTTNGGLGDPLNFASATPGAAPPVPEPSTFLLLGGGLIGAGFLRRRKSKQV